MNHFFSQKVEDIPIEPGEIRNILIEFSKALGGFGINYSGPQKGAKGSHSILANIAKETPERIVCSGYYSGRSKSSAYDACRDLLSKIIADFSDNKGQVLVVNPGPGENREKFSIHFSDGNMVISSVPYLPMKISVVRIGKLLDNSK